MLGDRPIVDLPQAVRAPDFRVIHWDEQTEFLAGIAAETALGKCCREVVLAQREGGMPFCSYGCPVMKLARAGRPVASYDMRLSTPFDRGRRGYSKVRCVSAGAWKKGGGFWSR